MKRWTKLGLPLALGLVAAAMNLAATTSKLIPYTCIRLSSSVPFGEPIQEDMLESIEVSGSLSNLAETFVPWKDRALLYGHPAPRSFEAGDLVLWRDAQPQKNVLPTLPGEFPMSVPISGTTVVPEFIQVGSQISIFVAKKPEKGSAETAVAKRVGPFRVLAVGHRTTQLGQGKTRDEKILTIAARIAKGGVLDEQSNRLLMSLKGFDGMQVMGVILHTTSNHINHVRPSSSTVRSTTS